MINASFFGKLLSNQSVADSISSMNFELNKTLHKYNTFKPHHALNLNTPLEYIQNSILEAV